MTDPLELMDEIGETNTWNGTWLTLEHFEALRAALEAQRDKLAKLTDHLHKMARDETDLRRDLAQAHARIARLEDGLESAKRDLRRAAMSDPDTGHYPAFHEVCELLAESPRQSAAAAIKAEALDKAADIVENADDLLGALRAIEMEADLIKREAKEQGDE